MTLETRDVDGIVIALIPGRALDARNAPAFKAAAAPLFESGAKVVFDMERVEFVDSAGIGALVSCLRRANTVQGELKLSSLTKQVRTLFQLVRMHQVLEIFNSCDEAIRSYQA